MKKNKGNKPVMKGIGNSIYRVPIVCAILFIVIFITYGQTLGFRLGKLDETNIILDNIRFLGDFKNLKEAFLTNPFFNKGGDFYRPLQNISLMIDANLSGENGWAYYLSNILIHTITCSLIYFMLTLFGKNRKIALLLTLIFAVHPLFVQTVAWAPSRGDLLLGMFGIASFIFFVLYIRNRSVSFLILNILAFGMALLSKETAVIIPVICFLYYFFIEKGQDISPRGLIIPAVSYLSFFALFMYIRNEIVGIVVEKGQFGLIPFLVHLRTIPEFISKFFLPLDLGPMPAFNPLSTISGLIILSLLIFILIRNQGRSWRVLLFGLIWFLLFIIPAIMYINKYGAAACDYMEHRAYLPLVGILIFVYIFLGNVPNIYENKTIPIILLIIIPVFAFYTNGYSKNYKTPLSYYKLAVDNNPVSAIAYFNLGTTNMNIGNDYRRAITDFNQAIRLLPDYAPSYNNRGYCKERLNEIEGALTDYRKASLVRRDWSVPHVNIATVKRNIGLYQEAILEYDTVLTLSPSFYQAYYERGSLKMEIMDYQGALDDLNHSISLNGSNPEAFFNRGILAFKLRDYNAALQDFNRAVQLNDKYTEAYVNRGVLFYQMEDYAGALRDFNQALLIDDKYAEAYLDRGMVRFITKDVTGACVDWEIAGRLGLADAEALIRKYCSAQ